MIDIKRLRQDPDGTRAALARRIDPSAIATLDRILDLDRRRRDILVRAETLKAERNAATEEVAQRKSAGTPADELLASLKVSADAVKALDADLRDVDEALEPELLTVPNLLLADVPDGDVTAQPRRARLGRAPPASTSRPKPHWELGEALGLSRPGPWRQGRRAPASRSFAGTGARLVRALDNFMLDLHTTRAWLRRGRAAVTW